MLGPYLRKYGVATTIDFWLFEVDGVDFRVDATFAAGDIKLMQDEGAEANTTNLPTDRGRGYSIVLTSSEMEAARLVLYIEDQTAPKVWLDKSIPIETYGHPSAQHAMDLDDAQRAGLASLPNANPAANGGLPTVDANNRIVGIQGTKHVFDDLQDLTAAQVNAQCDATIETYGLDHLVAAAVAGADVTDDSIIAQLVSKSVTADWGTYDNTTDSLEAIKDGGGGGPTAGEIADAVWDETHPSHQLANSFGRRVALEIPASLTTIATDTAEIGVAGAGLTNIPWNSSWDTEVESEVADALAVYDPPTKAEMDAGLAAVKLAADGLDSVMIETGINFRQAIALCLAALCGKASGMHTTVNLFKAAGADTTRIEATTDAYGNRSAIILTPPD